MKKHGFTLIEILVVLAIIGLLATILIPTVTSGLAKARRTQCLNNLHALGSVVQAYSSDHKGRLPGVGGGAAFDSYSAMVKGLYEGEYLETFDVLVCPLDTGRSVCPAANVESFSSGANSSYLYFAGYNTLRVTDRLSTLPVFCDRARAGGTSALTDADNHGASWRNVVYLDGHTAGLRTADDANAVVKVELPSGVTPVE